MVFEYKILAGEGVGGYFLFWEYWGEWWEGRRIYFVTSRRSLFFGCYCYWIGGSSGCGGWVGEYRTGFERRYG